MAVISWLVLKANLTYLRWIKARLIKRSVGTYCSVSKLCLTLCDPMNCSMPGFPVLHYLLEFAQTHVHWVSDAIQSSHSLLIPLSTCPQSFKYQGLFQRVSSSHEMAKVLELQLHYQAFQWILRADFIEDWFVWSPLCPRDFQESSSLRFLLI